jgi:hypothetical protein
VTIIAAPPRRGWRSNWTKASVTRRFTDMRVVIDACAMRLRSVCAPSAKRREQMRIARRIRAGSRSQERGVARRVDFEHGEHPSQQFVAALAAQRLRAAASGT